MRKVYFIILLSFSLLLVACSEAVVQQSNHKTDKEIRYAKLLTKEDLNQEKEVSEEIFGEDEELEQTQQHDEKNNKAEKEPVQADLDEVTKIVQENLNNISQNMPNYWDQLGADDTLTMINDMEMDNDSGDTHAQSGLVEDAKNRLKNEIASDSLDRLSRYFLIAAHASMHVDYVHNGDLHARFLVRNETKTSFDFTYITIDDAEAGYAIPAETTLSYQLEDGKWKLENIEHVYAEEKPLNITFDDLETYYANFTDDNVVFRPIEEKIINGVTYLTYQIGDRTLTRNAETSMAEYDK